MSTYKGKDDCTDTILDFLAGGVPDNPGGESRGNYNAVIGEVDSTDDLSKWTLGGIKDTLMPYLLNAHPRLNSTATGRYQFIKKTLTAEQAILGLGDDVHFTPEIQDRFAIQDLVGRGYSKWWADTLSDEEFAHNISLEWASEPDPENGGRSHYAGDGVNSNGTSLANLYAMLGRARAARMK